MLVWVPFLAESFFAVFFALVLAIFKSSYFYADKYRKLVPWEFRERLDVIALQNFAAVQIGQLDDE